MTRSTLRIRLPALCAAMTLASCGEPRIEPTAEQIDPQVPAPSPDNPAGPAPLAAPVAPGASYAAEDPDGTLPPSMTTPGPVPLDLRHVWAIEPADCTSDVGLTRISIAPGAIRFYEGRSVVLSSAETPDGVRLDVEHTSEGATSTQTHTLELDGQGQTLTYRRNGEVFRYRRCD